MEVKTTMLYTQCFGSFLYQNAMLVSGVIHYYKNWQVGIFTFEFMQKTDNSIGLM